jgi:DNA-binding response OmpR family regulator
VNFSTMEIHRKGQPVGLTCKQFKTLAYLIKNAPRVDHPRRTSQRSVGIPVLSVHSDGRQPHFVFA